jgi:hypothetical protein
VRQLVIILSRGAGTAPTTVIRDAYVELAAKWIKLAEDVEVSDAVTYTLANTNSAIMARARIGAKT